MTYRKLILIAVVLSSPMCAQDKGVVNVAPPTNVQANLQGPVAPQTTPAAQAEQVKKPAQVPASAASGNAQPIQNVVAQSDKSAPAPAQPNMPASQPAQANNVGSAQPVVGTQAAVPIQTATSVSPAVQQAVPSPVQAAAPESQAGQGIAQAVATVQEQKDTQAKKVVEQNQAAQPQAAPAPQTAQPKALETKQVEAAQPASDNTQSEKTVVEEEKLVGLEPEGIDTLDIEGGGNWLLKRGWWEQAERRYEKTKVLLDQIMDARMPFFEKRTDYDRNVLDPFYGQIGLDQGRLEETLSFLNDEINQEREKEGTLNEEQRAFLNTLAEQKKALEQLALDVAAINKLDHQVDAVIERLLDQVNKARGYEKQSWGAFKEIARELSDEKARELAGVMEAYYKYMEDIKTYIAQDLMQFYLNLMDEGIKQIEQIKSEMQALREKGIDIKSQAERMQQQEALLDKQQSEEEKEAEIRKATEAAKKAQMGFFGTAFSYITGFFKAVGGFIGWIFSSIYSAIMGLFGRK